MKQKLEEVRTVTITSKGQIAIPKSIRKKKFKEGAKLAILAFDDHIELRPVKSLERALDLTKPGVITSLMSSRSLAREWLSPEEEEAWKDL